MKEYREYYHIRRKAKLLRRKTTVMNGLKSQLNEFNV